MRYFFLFLVLSISISCEKEKPVSWTDNYKNIDLQIQEDLLSMREGFIAADISVIVHQKDTKNTDENTRIVEIAKEFYDNGSNHNALKTISLKYNISEEEFKTIKLLTTAFIFFEQNQEILNGVEELSILQSNMKNPLNLAPFNTFHARLTMSPKSEDCLLAVGGILLGAITSPAIATPFSAGAWIANMLMNLRSAQKSCN